MSLVSLFPPFLCRKRRRTQKIPLKTVLNKCCPQNPHYCSVFDWEQVLESLWVSSGMCACQPDTHKDQISWVFPYEVICLPCPSTWIKSSLVWFKHTKALWDNNMGKYIVARNVRSITLGGFFIDGHNSVWISGRFIGDLSIKWPMFDLYQWGPLVQSISLRDINKCFLRLIWPPIRWKLSGAMEIM